MDKKILAGMLSGIMMLGSVPVLAEMQKDEPHHIHQKMSRSADKQQQDDGVQRIHQQVRQSTSSHQEPPKDENGNPLPPPDGFRHGQQSEE